MNGPQSSSEIRRTYLKTVLLGAGASAATLGGQIAPVSKEFGSVLNSRIPDWQAQFPFLKSAVSYLQSQQNNVSENDWPLHVVWNGIDENFKLTDIIENPDFKWPSDVPPDKTLYRQFRNRSWRCFWILAGWELKRALAKIYGTILQEKLSNPKIAQKQVAKLLAGLEKRDIVASTNYDLLAESFIREKWPGGWNCLNEKEHRWRKKAQGPLVLKLHGSLDWLFQSHWITKRRRVSRTPEGSPITDEEIDLDRDFWETRPLVISPVRYKDEIVFPSTQPPELVEVLRFQWARLIEAVSRSYELQVLGYRFPSEDSYGNRLFQEAMRRRAGRRLKVLVYLPNDEWRKVKKRITKEIFGADKAEVEHCGLIH